MTESSVVTAFLRNRGEILCCRRSDDVGTYQGQWGAISGFAEGQPDEQVWIEIEEETGLDTETCSLVRSGRPLEFTDPDLGRAWTVHPYLLDCPTRDIELSDEHDTATWTTPTLFLPDVDAETVYGATTSADTAVADGEFVPKLWAAYERVAPTVRSIAADDTHGAAWLSLRALEVLRDRAGVVMDERGQTTEEAADETGSSIDATGEWAELRELGSRLLEVRPSMAVLRTRVDRAMGTAFESGPADDDQRGGDGAVDATRVHRAACGVLEHAARADERTAERAAEELAGTVLTHSRSETVRQAIDTSSVDRVYVTESRPGLEGRAVARSLADDRPVTLHTDAAGPWMLASEAIDHVVVGADTIRPDGAVVNKTGTRGLAVAAAREEVPVTVVAASDKISTREEVALESGPRSAVYDGEAPLDVTNPTFDVTPADCLTAIVTERGVLEPAAVADVVEEHRELERWRIGDTLDG